MQNKTENINEPHIKIFNEEINSDKKEKINHDKSESCCKGHHGYCSKHRGSGVFGLMLLSAGLLLLLNNFNVISRDIWVYILPFWPVILILIGIKMIIGTSRIAKFVYFMISLLVICYILMSAWVSSTMLNTHYMNNIKIISITN